MGLRLRGGLFAAENEANNGLDLNEGTLMRLKRLLPVFSLMGLSVFILALFVIKVVWAWTIPDLPGAVEEGLIAGSLSWFTTFKLAIFVALLGALAGAQRRGNES